MATTKPKLTLIDMTHLKGLAYGEAQEKLQAIFDAQLLPALKEALGADLTVQGAIVSGGRVGLTLGTLAFSIDFDLRDLGYRSGKTNGEVYFKTYNFQTTVRPRKLKDLESFVEAIREAYAAKMASEDRSIRIQRDLDLLRTTLTDMGYTYRPSLFTAAVGSGPGFSLHRQSSSATAEAWADPGMGVVELTVTGQGRVVATAIRFPVVQLGEVDPGTALAQAAQFGKILKRG